ncbi:serine/threonine-protein kinase [Actinomadura mexicana]|uniref:non-specific serine/threonine protein kinase n=1 Tax=Actinomadura mexicana TaxID=134959 RepID=A0A238X0I5_9ACTN|nr:serine/threonine-protein kinase [Actinomadura mexicana]SNR52128.1 Serine/threonine protein kinase [Actinomadura mexicana]
MAQEAHLERIGGRYRLVEVLGSGGFGRVWRAHDETLGVDVAVKEVRLQPTASEEEREEFLTRAKREARNAARLRDHPGIVPVHDVVIEGGVPWIVMRLIDGHSLEDRLEKDRRVPAGEAAGIAAALLEALDAAHRAGVVHRDVKPANVMLARSGEVLLTDFGIAVHQTDTAMTASGALIGSMAYLAPERLRGRNNGTAGDLFSLGVTLYRCVEGVSPFHRDTPAETVTALLRDEPPPPRHAGGLARLIVRLLDKDPGTRPTAAEALELIGPAPAPRREVTATRRPDRDEPGKRWWLVFVRSRRRVVALTVASVLAIPLLLGIGYIRAYGGTAYDAKPDECVHPNGLDLDGLGGWRTHPCSTPPGANGYLVTYRYEWETACASSNKVLVLPERKGKGPITLCLVPAR